VPLTPFARTLARIKSELGLKIAAHTKLVDRRLAESLAPTGIDTVMVDVVNTRVLQKVFHLRDKTIEDIQSSLDILDEFHLPASPHIILGLGCGNGPDSEDLRIMEILKGRRLKSLVIVFLMPLPHTPMAQTEPPSLKQVNRIFREARSSFPGTPLFLGCAKPAGPYQAKVEILALRHGFNGIAFPGDEVVQAARKRNYRIRFEETCCALID